MNCLSGTTKFDVVMSSIGVMFAPFHQLAAGEPGFGWCKTGRQDRF